MENNGIIKKLNNGQFDFIKGSLSDSDKQIILHYLSVCSPLKFNKLNKNIIDPELKAKTLFIALERYKPGIEWDNLIKDICTSETNKLTNELHYYPFIAALSKKNLFLLEQTLKGFDPQTLSGITCQGQSISHWAIYFKYVHGYKYLKNYGIMDDIRNSRGQTILEYADSLNVSLNDKPQKETKINIDQNNMSLF